MTTDVKQIFYEALDHAGMDRKQFLNEACADNGELRQKVESLLLALEKSDGFLESPVTLLSDASIDHALEVRVEMNSGENRDVLNTTLIAILSYVGSSERPGTLGRFADYDLLEVVGQGGMGSVFRAFDPKLQRIVAIKVLSPVLAADPSAHSRFLGEARAMAAVRDENVVQVYAVDEFKLLPFLVMEYVDGKTLQQKIESQGKLPIDQVVRIATQIATGLAAAHRQGLIHRDIKPANIMLENGVERVKIMDFGLARATSDARVTRVGHIAGTPEFMSPEQARGKPIDARSDLFSFGSVVFTMCAGKPPFHADDSFATMLSVCEQSIANLREINPEVPVWLMRLTTRLLEKNPDARCQTAEEVRLNLINHTDLGTVRTKRRIRWSTVLPLVAFTSLIGLFIAEQTGITRVHEYLAGNAVNNDSKLLGNDHSNSSLPPVPSHNAAQATASQKAWAERLNKPISETNTLGMQMVLIPPGRFRTANPREEGFPERSITITQPFYLSATEVTVGQFRQFVMANNYTTSGELDTSRPLGSGLWNSPGYSLSDDQPVVFISQLDAQAFCDWLTKKENRNYRLPTDAQWELAARAGSSADHWYTDNDSEDSEFAWFGGKSQTVSPVARKQPNPYGLYDIYGNAWEWLCDWHISHKSGNFVDPISSTPSQWKVLAGGSFVDGTDLCSSVGRIHGFPKWCNNTTGFRVMYEIVPAATK